MKKLKTGIWIFVLLLIETVIGGRMSVYGASPDFMLIIMVCIAVMDEKLSYAEYAGLICGICSGSLTGRNFFVSVILYAAFALVIYRESAKKKYMSTYLKFLIWICIVTFVSESALYFASSFALAGYIGLLKTTLWKMIIYNAVIGTVICFIIKKTIYRQEAKKQLIRV